MKKIIISFVVISIYISCNFKNQITNQQVIIEELPSFSKHGGEPNLSVSSNGEVYLSWIEYKNDSTDVLMFSKLIDHQWSERKIISEGSNWFVNWADFPSLKPYKNSDKLLAAHWLQKSDSGTYDYDVRISQSKDGGLSWDSSFVIHKDSIAAEHGFVSLMPTNEQSILAVWLDGRKTKSHTSTDKHNPGPMTLRSAEIDINGKITNQVELDDRVCDCCQTDIAYSKDGPIVVYRDRSGKEIRDISYVRKVKNEWTKPKPISIDNWKIAGCPVNGPAIDAKDQLVVVAWYTMQDGNGNVNISFSNNGGETFEKPISVSSSNPLGRVDIILLDDNKAAVSWIEEVNNETFIKFKILDQKGHIYCDKNVASISSERSSGFPRMVKNKDKVIFAWTQSTSKNKNIKTALVNIK